MRNRRGKLVLREGQWYLLHDNSYYNNKHKCWVTPNTVPDLYPYKLDDDLVYLLVFDYMAYKEWCEISPKHYIQLDIINTNQSMIGSGDG